MATSTLRFNQPGRFQDSKMLRDCLTGRSQSVLGGKQRADLEQSPSVARCKLVEDDPSGLTIKCTKDVSHPREYRQAAACLSRGSDHENAILTYAMPVRYRRKHSASRLPPSVDCYGALTRIAAVGRRLATCLKLGRDLQDVATTTEVTIPAPVNAYL